MEILKKIDLINSLDLDKRINAWKDIIVIAESFINSKNHEDNIAFKLLDCIRGMRTSRFIDTEVDIKLLDVSIEIARKLLNHPKLLKELLNDAIYYSNFYPKKYNKMELEKEIKEIERLH